MPKPPKLPLEPLSDLLAWWRKTKTKGMIIGGLAVAFRGRPRTTNDVDAVVLVDENRWPTFLEHGRKYSFVSRVPDAIAFAEENRIFLVRHEKSGTDIDLSIAGTEFERHAIKRARNVKTEAVSLPVASVEDLIILKAIANRPIDDTDILRLLETSANLDLSHSFETVCRLVGIARNMPEF